MLHTMLNTCTQKTHTFIPFKYANRSTDTNLIFFFFFYFTVCGQHDFGNDKDLKSLEGIRKVTAKKKLAKNITGRVFPDLCGDMPNN